jgi:L-seryl-tRNA(Ser) seleniumtransferase
VDRVVAAPALASSRAALGTRTVTGIAREVIAGYRELVRAGQPAPSEAEVVEAVLGAARRRLGQRLEAVVNATGVLLHTNLGRAPLPASSLERMLEVARGYCALEFDLELGVRSRRGAAIDARLAELVGADAALVVNNNAAAVLLALGALASGREVVVSRGELVEIGGGFRIPEVLQRSGARLVEVGTTNRTRVEDYVAAFSDRTAGVLRVHPSNFTMSGFAERPALSRLANAVHEHGLILIKDLGGGLVTGLPESIAAPARDAEPSVQRCLGAGADLVCFSLDKLFGGPQGGVVVGAAELVDRLRGDPLARALRVGKSTLAALEPVVEAYAREDIESIPLHAMLRAPLGRLRERVEGWQSELGTAARHTRVVDSEATVGGGTLAGAVLPSVALEITSGSPDTLARELRIARPAVVGRVSGGALLLDARTVLPAQDPAVAAALCQVLSA